jgi:hypothetical protein
MRTLRRQKPQAGPKDRSCVASLEPVNPFLANYRLDWEASLGLPFRIESRAGSNDAISVRRIVGGRSRNYLRSDLCIARNLNLLSQTTHSRLESRFGDETC